MKIPKKAQLRFLPLIYIIIIYLDYEDFGHVGLGYETYSDGVQHPLELRKILTGELSKVRLDKISYGRWGQGG